MPRVIVFSGMAHGIQASSVPNSLDCPSGFALRYRCYSDHTASEIRCGQGHGCGIWNASSPIIMIAEAPVTLQIEAVGQEPETADLVPSERSASQTIEPPG